MKLRTPEGKLKTRVKIGLAAAAGAVLLPACATEEDGSPQKTVTITAKPEAPAAHTWNPPKNAKWPGRITLSYETCTLWGPDSPEPRISANRKLIFVDARYNNPQDCNPDTDIGLGAHRGPSGGAPYATKQPGVQGNHIPDGTVVKVIAVTRTGEPTTDAHMYPKSPDWVQFQAGPDAPSAWGSVANFGWVSMQGLIDAGVPQVRCQPMTDPCNGA
ncbi:MAG TPA: hypothetical protein VMY99_01835 [Nevskiaceae bacterium]|nr:hypothetical protein [Nevskiaceae bacterium]